MGALQFIIDLLVVGNVSRELNRLYNKNADDSLLLIFEARNGDDRKSLRVKRCLGSLAPAHNEKIIELLVISKKSRRIVWPQIVTFSGKNIYMKINPEN